MNGLFKYPKSILNWMWVLPNIIRALITEAIRLKKLLEEAKIRYPKGTHFTHRGSETMVSNGKPYFDKYGGFIRVDYNDYSPAIYFPTQIDSNIKGWVEIVKEPLDEIIENSNAPYLVTLAKEIKKLKDNV